MSYDKIIATWNEFIQEFPDAIDLAEFDLLHEDAYIKKVGSEWCIFSQDGSNLGCKGSKKEAEDRLAEIEMFKHMKDNSSKSLGKQECECLTCGKIYWDSDRCDICPRCGSENVEELTGIL